MYLALGLDEQRKQYEYISFLARFGTGNIGHVRWLVADPNE